MAKAKLIATYKRNGKIVAKHEQLTVCGLLIFRIRNVVDGSGMQVGCAKIDDLILYAEKHYGDCQVVENPNYQMGDY